MTRSLFSFAQALKLVDEQGASAGLDRLMGGALFVGAAAAGPSALPVLGLVDPKNEATRLLAPVVDRLAAKARGTSGRTRQDLLVAAHTITVLSAFFDAVGKETRLELTDEDRHRLAKVPADGGFVDRALNADVPFPSAEHPLLDNLNARLRPLFADLASRSLQFLSGLDGFHGPINPAHVVDRAATLYLDRMLQLGPKPPFALWLTLTEHGATHQALSELETLLRQIAAGSAPTRYRAQLAGLARRVLDKRLLRTDQDTLLTPTVRDGFVEPAFQLAIHGSASRVSGTSWWADQPTHDGLVDFLAAHLASRTSTANPLLILGDPGAGKSLLTEVLAARLPTESFAVLLVPLREVDPGDDLHLQITRHLRRVLQKERVEWDDLRQECGPCAECIVAERICTHQARLVVVLDGFDELVQATGVAQTGYLEAVKRFQRASHDLGTPVAVIVTSRTIVADRAEIPSGTPVVRLERFDDARIERWTTAWNAARAGTEGYVSLSSEELLANASVAELARDPLLLLVLAIYLAELGRPGFGREDLTSAQLYRRLLDRFIERQVDKDGTEMTDAERKRRRRTQRRELQITAFGMFNRGRQHITHEELDDDLAALAKTPERMATLGERLTEARRVLSEFLFLHHAPIHGERRGTYEFLHATFGEYLVAEFIATELTRFAKVLVADEETTLDDALFGSLLAHEAVSQRDPILPFLRELADGVPAVLVENLLRAARYRPDAAEARYRPVQYDPVRRRAAYLANLVLLRVYLDDEPVTIRRLAESSSAWASMLRLWRAGLPHESWASVVMSLTRVHGSEALVAEWGNPHGTEAKEADLLGNPFLTAALVSGNAFLRDDPSWSGDDMAVHANIASFLPFRTATPLLNQLLPYEQTVVEDLVKVCDDAVGLNGASAFQIGRMLARDAADLPIDLVQRLVTHALPGADSRDLAAAVIAHPRLLSRVPELSERVVADMSQSVPVVTLLWLAEGRCVTSDSTLLRDLRFSIDRGIADNPASWIRNSWFTPKYLNYLRQERPSYWTDFQKLRDQIADFTVNELKSIEPDDAEFLAGDDGAAFAAVYLRSRGVAFARGDEIAALRALAARVEAQRLDADRPAST